MSLLPLTQYCLAIACCSSAQPKELNLAVWLPETQVYSEPNMRGSMRTEDISKPHMTCMQSIEQKIGWKVQTKVVFQIYNFALCYPSLNSHQDPKKDLHGGEKQPINKGSVLWGQSMGSDMSFHT